MKKKSFYLFLFLFTHQYYAHAQKITTDNTQQPNTLIQDLVGNSCATASNVASSINGSLDNIVSYGSFNSDTSNFPFQNGLVLSTGSVSSAGNTLIASDLNEGSINWPTDSDIEAITGITQTLNATSIEFDFETVNNFVSFKYIFASDEYQQEYPCNFKDVFAILIKRAGTADSYVNIATVPNTIAEISTNTIHANINGFCEAQNDDYFEGYNIGDTNYNGRTEILTARADIIPNETYHIKFVIADHIDQRFDSAVFIESEGFGNSIDLGPDQSICGSDLTLNANINNASAIYKWYLNGNELTGESNATLEVNQSGNYEVEVTIPSVNNNCALTDSIVVEIIPFQDAEPIEDWLACDAFPSDNLFEFDFTLKNDEIYSNLPSTDYNISYHFNIDDAQNNINPITGIYQNTETIETIFVRIESLTGDCLQIGSFSINISETPDSLEFTVDVCNNSLVESSFSNFTFLGNIVSNYDLNSSVSFYLTENDVITNLNQLSQFPPLNENITHFYAKIERPDSLCYSTVLVNLNYLVPTDIGIETYIFNQCLDPLLIETINSIPYNYNSLPISYNLEDAMADIEADYPEISVNLEALIMGYPRIITTASEEFSILVSIRYNDENCPTFMNMEFHKNLLYNRVLSVPEITKCDDELYDGIEDFSLTEIIAEFKGDYDIELQVYETEENLLNDINALDPSTILTVTNSKTIYISSSYENCSLVSEMNLIVTPGLYISPIAVDYCGYTDLNTNSTNIILEPLKAAILEENGIIGPVEFYLSEEDAENQENELIDSYSTFSSQQTFYVRVSDVFSGCYDISTIEANITNAIEANNPEPLIICDDDQDGTSTINLLNLIPQISNGNNNLSFAFYKNFDDALVNESVIENLNNYSTATTTLYIRVEALNLECFSIIPYDISIYSNPELPPVSNFINCETNLNLPSEFFFVDKDSQIIGNQASMKVLYFETENNAINNNNPIDKNTAYLPSSNPQTIYVRLQNEDYSNCFKVAPMQIEVRQAPIYNNPTDIFECDANKTGLATTNLNEKIEQISANSPTNLNVTFHLSPLNAIVGANEIPLNYTSISNPQIIYARIENTNSSCFDIQTFNINTLSLPEVTYGQSLTACGNNYNFYTQWNLTEIELNVLDGRQYNIDFTYFESETDLLADNNRIPNPEAYTNTSNPQTIYAKIRNATTDCFDIVPFQLIVNSPPQINEFQTFNICENSENQVDLLEINEIILDDSFNVIIGYYANETSAENKENPLDSNYTYLNTTETLFARVEYSTTQCYAVYPFQLFINALPVANQPNDLIVCDDDIDGFVELDLTQQNSAILGNQNPNEYSISFYNSEINAIENLQPFNQNHIAFNNEIIFVRVENIATGCYAITQFSTVINSIPTISIPDQVVCLNNLPLVVSAETNNPLDSYLWSTSATTSQIEITEIDTYSVTITNQFGCQNTSTFNVIESESATIDVVETIDFSDPNNITVTINGIGDYLYQLNNSNPQISNVFENVPIGYNTITIIDQNGCAEVNKTVLVIDAPKHMSPNNDGDFDTWHIAGVETLPGTVINIFDRKGKLLKQLKHDSLGWDGTYNGQNMPASDYWFTAIIQQNGKSFKILGHFALRR